MKLYLGGKFYGYSAGILKCFSVICSVSVLVEIPL